MSLGERIRELRESMGLSQTDLARKVGITPTYVSKIESGRSVPAPLTLGQIADALGASREEFLVLTGHLPEEPMPNPSSPLWDELVAVWQRLTPERQMRVLRFARFELAEIERERREDC